MKIIIMEESKDFLKFSPELRAEMANLIQRIILLRKYKIKIDLSLSIEKEFHQLTEEIRSKVSWKDVQQ